MQSWIMWERKIGVYISLTGVVVSAYSYESILPLGLIGKWYLGKPGEGKLWQNDATRTIAQDKEIYLALAYVPNLTFTLLTGGIKCMTSTVLKKSGIASN